MRNSQNQIFTMITHQLHHSCIAHCVRINHIAVALYIVYGSITLQLHCTLCTHPLHYSCIAQCVFVVAHGHRPFLPFNQCILACTHEYLTFPECHTHCPSQPHDLFVHTQSSPQVVVTTETGAIVPGVENVAVESDCGVIRWPSTAAGTTFYVYWLPHHQSGGGAGLHFHWQVSHIKL